MKGILLAGGTGTRLLPLTKVTNKHLLPVYDKPMIFYPLATLLNAGIRDILIVTGAEYAGDFMQLLGSGKNFSAKFTYRIQDEAGGIAQALSLAEDFVNGDSCFVILGDNVFEDDFKPFVDEYEKAGGKGGMVFLKQIPDPQRFGVAELSASGELVGIEEKPKVPKSNLAVSGAYLYDSRVFEIAKTLKPSWRNELEITDVNNHYLVLKELKYKRLGKFSSDAGTFPSLAESTHYVAEADKKGVKIGAVKNS